MFPRPAIVLFLVVASLLGPAHARATAAPLPASVRADAPWSLVGSDELRLFGVRIYQAGLWTPNGEYQPGVPLAFNLRYQRGFSREELVEITVSAWQKLGTVSQAQQQQWASQLDAIWQDVARGDLLTAVVQPAGGTRFHSASGLLGRIDDPEFGPAFLAIWLDSRTQLPELREALIGSRQP